MKKRKPIVVWMNGKKTKVTSSNKNNTYRLDKEHAATIEDHTNNDDNLPTLARQHSLNEMNFKQKSKFSMYKPIIIATVSAVVIGLCMGIIMLNMFVGIGKEADGDGNVANNLLADTTANETSTNNQPLQNVTFEQINAFILQAGVFSSEANADKWSKKYEQAGFSTMIWNRNDKYFLMAGMSSTKEQATIQAEQFKENGFDIYVKEWSTGEVDKELTKEEGEWVHSFRDTWYESVMAVTSQENISIEPWKSLMDSYPAKSEHVSSLFDSLKSSYKKLGEVDPQSAQIILLNQWKQYEATLF